MTEDITTILAKYAPPVMRYYKQVEFAARIKQCGVPDLIALIYESNKVSLSDAASICDSPPEMQRAACDIVRCNRELFSLRDSMGALDKARETKEWESLDPFPLDLATTPLFVQDYELAIQIKERAEPDLLVLLDRGWVVLQEILEVCDQHPVIQQEASKRMWIRNARHKTLILADAIAEFQKTPEVSK